MLLKGVVMITNQQLIDQCREIIADESQEQWCVDICKVALASLTSGKSPVIPDGWVTVPLQPSVEMITAWRKDMGVSYAKEHAEKIGEDEIVFAHQAMLAAAPEPPC